MRLLLLLALTACAGVQGAPMAPRAPSFSPVTDAPLTVGQPGYVAQPDAPRGTDRRVLPPTNEPGVWTAGAPMATSDPGTGLPKLLGVTIPYPPDAIDDADKNPTRACVVTLSLAFGAAGNASALARLTPAERICASVSLFEFCANITTQKKEEAKAAGTSYDAESLSRWRATAEHAKYLHKKACGAVDLDYPTDLLLGTVLAAWERGFKWEAP